MQALAYFFVYLLLAYLAIGLVVAIFMAFVGLQKIDTGAADTSWGFRLLMIPGSVAFWPHLLSKWIKSRKS